MGSPGTRTGPYPQVPDADAGGEARGRAKADRSKAESARMRMQGRPAGGKISPAAEVPRGRGFVPPWLRLAAPGPPAAGPATIIRHPLVARPARAHRPT